MFAPEITEDGFTVVPNVLEPEEIPSLLDRVQLPTFHRSRAGIRHVMSNSHVASLAHDARLMTIAREVFGSEPVPFRATLFDKSHDANWLVVWHQDTALPLRSKKDSPGWGPWSVKEGIHYAHAPTYALDQVVALRVHLDDSTVENGPLRVIPGTHKLGVLTDDEVSKLSIERVSVDCLAARGAVLAMRPLLIHSSSKSQSERPRRVLHIEYAASTVVGDGLELAIA